MMMDTDAGRMASPTGSIAFGDEAAVRLRPSGDDPLRGDKAFQRVRGIIASGLGLDSGDAIDEAAADIVVKSVFTAMRDLSFEQLERATAERGIAARATMIAGDVYCWWECPDQSIQPVILDVDVAADFARELNQVLSDNARDSDTHPKGGDASGSGSAE